MFISSARYKSLDGRKPIEEKEYYHGIYQNKPIMIDRKFRDHRLTDEECRALCDGESIEIHNLHNGMTVYGVRGMLREDLLSRGRFEMPVYMFKATMSVVNKPDYDFSKRKVVKPQETQSVNNTRSEEDEMRDALEREDADLRQWTQHTMSEDAYVSPTTSHTKKPQLILHEAVLDEFSDEEDSKLAARVAATTEGLPPVVPVYKNAQDLKVYVPVIAGMVYTKNGMAIVSDEDALSQKYDFTGRYDVDDVFIPHVSKSDAILEPHASHTENINDLPFSNEEEERVHVDYEDKVVAEESLNYDFVPMDIGDSHTFHTKESHTLDSHTETSHASHDIMQEDTHVQIAGRDLKMPSVWKLTESEVDGRTYDEVMDELNNFARDCEYGEYEELDYEDALPDDYDTEENNNNDGIIT